MGLIERTSKNKIQSKSSNDSYVYAFKDSTKIKTCPFCGKPPWTGGIYCNWGGITWTIECREDHFSFTSRNEQKVADYWNTRKGENYGKGCS